MHNSLFKVHTRLLYAKSADVPRSVKSLKLTPTLASGSFTLELTSSARIDEILNWKAKLGPHCPFLHLTLKNSG